MATTTEQATEATLVTPPPAPPKSRLVNSPKNYTGLLIFTLILSLIAAVSSGSILYLYWQSLQIEVVEELPETAEIADVEYITFGDYTLPIHDSLAVNLYDQESFTTDENGIISYPNAKLGIDVSQHQEEIDWQAVAEDGVSFAFIRLGYRGYGEEGSILLDTYFHQNMEGAKDAGLDVGVYFFSQSTSVWETMEEAYFVLEQLEGYELDLPVVFNWEFIDYSSYARTNTILGECITLYNQVFNEQMQKAGYDTMVYFNQSLGYLYLDLELLEDNHFWLASYRSSPNFYYHFDLWQYSDTGTINGIEGDVDLNLMFTDLSKEDDVEDVIEDDPTLEEPIQENV